MFLKRYGLAIVKLLSGYSKSQQISKYTLDNRRWTCECEKEVTDIESVKTRIKACGFEMKLGI